MRAITPTRAPRPMGGETRTIAELSRALKARDVTAEAVLAGCLQRIAVRNSTLNAFIAVFEGDAREQARAADREIAAGRYRGPLHGIPISIKDLFDVRGSATTAASRVRRDHVAPRDAVSIERLRTAGAVFVGKTNLHEFALGTTNEESAFGPARHPLDPSRSPGGSSGGSAVSVADGMCVASLGTDTGGSIRIPAAACGLVGLKPTLGELSTDGVLPLSTTLDHIGPICRSVEDAAIVYDALRGETSPATATSVDLGGVSLGIPRPFFLDRLDPDVAGAFEGLCGRLRNAGARLRDVAIPHAGDVGSIYMHMVLPEAAVFHADTLERQPGDYTPNVRLRLEMGRYVLAEDYARAQRGRAVITAEVDAALDGCDGLCLPGMAIPAPTIGATTIRLDEIDEPVRNLMLRCTQIFNISGHPAIALPCGRTRDGLPVSAQLVGRRHATTALLGVARAVESCLAGC